MTIAFFHMILFERCCQALSACRVDAAFCRVGRAVAEQRAGGRY
jgi:hypothetical protein